MVNVDELRLGTSWAEVVSTTNSQPPLAPASAPVITQSLLNGSSLILRGTNGTPGNSYEVLSTSTLAGSWSAIHSNTFSGTGTFDCTNPVNTALAQAYFRLRTGNSSGTTNPPATNAAPTIITPPQNQTVSVGGTAVFSVAASGSAPLRYQWFFTNAASPGATNSSLTLTGVTTNHAGNYFVRVTNDFGAVTSSVVALTVNPAPKSFVTRTK